MLTVASDRGSLQSHPPVVGPAAIDANDLRRDVAGTLHAEEGHLTADFVGLAPSVHGDPVSELRRPDLLTTQGKTRVRHRSNRPLKQIHTPVRTHGKLKVDTPRQLQILVCAEARPRLRLPIQSVSMRSRLSATCFFNP